MKNTLEVACNQWLKVLTVILLVVSPLTTIGAQETTIPDTVPVPTFSLPRGLYERSMTLTLSCSDTVARLYYTTDGSVPTPDNGTLYLSPLTISGTTPLRVVAVRTGWQGQVMSSPVATSKPA